MLLPRWSLFALSLVTCEAEPSAPLASTSSAKPTAAEGTAPAPSGLPASAEPVNGQRIATETNGVDAARQRGSARATWTSSEAPEPLAPPALDEPISIPVGDECGFEAADGTEIGCEPGAYCLKASSETPAICVLAKRAQRWGG